MRKKLLQRVLDAPSAWGLRILCIASFIVTGILALMKSPRVIWLVFTTFALVLLYVVNHLRIQRKLKRVQGSAIRPKRKPHTPSNSAQ